MAQELHPLTFPLNGTRLIEASAGTGKTFTIALLYVRLVLQHGGGAAFPRALNPQDILVVTFTNAATEELRDRIRRRLTQAAHCFRGQDHDPLLVALRNDYPEDKWLVQARILELAASNMDEAAIHTIHGWSQRMLRQHAFDSGNNFGAELEGDDSELLADVARDYWRTFVSSLSVTSYEQIKKEVADPDALASRIDKLLNEHRSAPLGAMYDDMERWVEDFETIQAEVRPIWSAQAGEIRSWYENAAERGWLNKRDQKPDQIPEDFEQLAAWSRRESAITEVLVRRYSSGGLSLNKKAESPHFEAMEAMDRLREHLGNRVNAGDQLLRHAAAWCARRLEAAKHRFNRMNFDDLLTRLGDALAGGNGEALAQRIRRQFPVALIDEFQDTDPVQYAVFRQLYVGRPDQDAEPLGLFMIGDPKQAIYKFRGADIYTYLKAREDTEGAHYTLKKNYRSEASLVDAVNHLFLQARNYHSGPFLFQDQIPFVEVKANGRADPLMCDERVVEPLTLWHPETATATSAVDYRNLYAQATASQIVDQLTLGEQGKLGFASDKGIKPLRAADIAVLVRSGSEADLMKSALAARGIRSVFLSEKSAVYQTQEACDLLMWLEAVAEPLSESRLRRALATKSLGLDFSRLDRSAELDTDWERETERFTAYHALWQERGVLPLIRRMMDDYQVAGQLLQRVNGERALTNLLQLGELLQQAETKLDGPQALLRFLEEHIEQESGAAGEEQILRLESDESLVKIVTIHKSKGLEYPLVYLPFVCAAKKVDRSSAPIKIHVEGESQWRYQLSEQDKALADRERLAEDLRLLYVALTRASHACWVGMAPLGSENKKGYRCDLSESAIGYLLTEGKPLPPPGFLARLEQLTLEDSAVSVRPCPRVSDSMYQPSVVPVSMRPARDVVGPAREPWWVGSYSSLARSAHSHGKTPSSPGVAEDSPEEANLKENDSDGGAERAGRPPIFDPETEARHGFPKGAQAGTFLHAILEWAAREGFDNVVENHELRREFLEKSCERRGLLEWAEGVDRWIQAILSTPMQPPGEGQPLRLQDLTVQQAKPEMEFWFAAHGVDSTSLDQCVQAAIFPQERRAGIGFQRLNGMLKGFIDLVFEWQGRYYVMDYKSNVLGEDDAAYTDEAMRNAVLDHRYDLQYVLYTLALHRLLRARLPGYRYEKHMGGVMYFFLRGIQGPEQGIHRVCPPRALIDQIDQQFREQPQEVLDGF